MADAAPAQHLAVARAALERDGYAVDVTLGAPDPDSVRRLAALGAGAVAVRRFFASLNGARVRVRRAGEDAVLAEVTVFDAATLVARRENERFPLGEVRGVACFLARDGTVLVEDPTQGALPAAAGDVETWFHRVCHALMRRADPRFWRAPAEGDEPPAQTLRLGRPPV